MQKIRKDRAFSNISRDPIEAGSMDRALSIVRRKRRRRKAPFDDSASFLSDARKNLRQDRLVKVIVYSCCVLQALSYIANRTPPTLAFVPRWPNRVVSNNAIQYAAERTSRWPTKTSITHSKTPSTTTALFGIKGFRAWFQDQFPNAVRNVDVSEHKDRFDHVLIDMNQILHVILRRSRNTEQATKLLMVELDNLLERCNPVLSLVLAVDGSPAAAKLATQRKRRFSILKNTQFKLKHSDKLRMSKRKRARRLRNYKSELQSLQLTPGTECMQTMESAILYWAWQRLQSQGRPSSRLLPKVRIYISSSQVPGEGEIKLLEWINNHRRQLARRPGQSIALIGGDADLLLEAMVIPPSWTHNVFVLRPEESERNTQKGINSESASSKQLSKNKKWQNRKNIMHCTSLWEMTLSLDDYCQNNIPKEHYNPTANPDHLNLLLQIRTDMVLLFMLNGNDYLPRVVAVGFRGVLKSYLTLLERWIQRTGSIENVGLVDPNTLNFRSDFCAEFFHILGRNAPSERERWKSVKYSQRRTYQSIVNDMSAIGFLPSPVKFEFVGSSINGEDGIEVPELDLIAEDEQDDAYNNDDEEEDDDDDDDDVDDDEEEEDDEDEEIGSIGDIDELLVDESGGQVMQLALGNKKEADYHTYNVRVGGSSPKAIQKAKKALSRMALKEFSLLDYVQKDGDSIGTDYDWEIDLPADANVDRYLAGLIWTLQTYQDGVCPSYHYNYGKCLAPSGRVIASFFEKAVQEKREVGAAELLRDYKPGGSVCAGVACLAALPISVKDLVPEPYSLVDDELVEDFYSQCMDPVDNFFHLKKFEDLVEAEVERIAQVKRIIGGGKDDEENEESSSEFFSGRQIILGDHYWTVMQRTKEVIQHPFQPPIPPADNYSKLRPSNRIKASRIISMDFPSPRPSINAKLFDSPSSESNYPRKLREKNNIEIDHLKFGSLIEGSNSSLSEIPYKIPFGSYADIFGCSQSSKGKTQFKLLRSHPVEVSSRFNGDNSDIRNQDNDDISEIIPVAIINPDSQNALVILKQLCDIQVVGGFEFDESSGKELTLTVFKDETFDNLPSEKLSFTHPCSSSRKSLTATRQHLASLALDAIMYSEKINDGNESKVRWYELTFQGMKDFLELHHSAMRKDIVNKFNPEQQTSLVILKQLCDIGIVTTYEFNESPANSDDPAKLSLSITMDSVDSPDTLLFERIRTNESKKWIRHELASLALDTMISGGSSMEKAENGTVPNWYDLTFNDTKSLIKRAD